MDKWENWLTFVAVIAGVVYLFKIESSHRFLLATTLGEIRELRKQVGWLAEMEMGRLRSAGPVVNKGDPAS